MGRFNPLFERAGMRRIDPVRDGESVYYILDRAEQLKNPLPNPLPVPARGSDATAHT
jgi:hypothetical protein